MVRILDPTAWPTPWTLREQARRPEDPSGRGAKGTGRCQPAARHLGVVVLNRTAPDPALYDAHL